MYVDAKNEAKLNKKLTDDQVNFKSAPLLNGFLYNIKTKSPSISVPDIRPEIRTLIGTTSSLITKMNKDYEAFNKSKETMVPIKEKIDRLIVEEKTEKATQLMEELFEDNKYINTQQVVAYAKSMKERGMEKQLWDRINELYLKNPSASYADFSRQVSYVSTYPSIELKKLWMERQMEWEEKDVSFLKDYYKSFNTSDNTDKIDQVLEVLNEIEPNLENQKTYFNFLINSKSAKLLSKLNGVEPCSIDDEELATTISLAYANNLNFNKALEWQKCAKDISPSVLSEWTKKSNSIEDKKITDFPYYIKYLMVNNRNKAIEEMQNIASCRPDLAEISSEIAILFSEYALYKKALDWSTCANNISIINILDWNLEAGNDRYLKPIYNDHMSKNPNDYDTMNHMAKILLLKGDVEGAGKIAVEIPPTKLDSDFKIAFNNEVKIESDQTQSLYISKFKILMDDAIVSKSAIETRKKKGHSVGFNSSAIANKFDLTLLNNSFHFGFYNKKFNLHRFSIVQGSAYAVLKDTIVPNDIDRDLLGVEYLYRAESNLTNPFWVGARIELDNFDKAFVHFNTGINFIGENNKTTLALNLDPVSTGPGYDLEIYDLEFKAKQEFKYNENFKHIFKAKGNYYTDSQYYIEGGTRLEYKLINLDKFKLGPLAEGAYALGSEDRNDGFPYWITENRLYGGGGLLVQIGNEQSDFNLKSDFSIFAEQDEPTFQRYEGILSYRIKDFTTINLNYTYFTIDQFFANAFQLGIQYNFK
jgi:tetratricopeptide (TPR) repeat protein